MQSGQQLLESMPTSTTAWMSIYDGALEKDEAKVTSALSRATLTFLNNEGRSPVYQLAYDATIESIAALHFLLWKFPSSSMALQREMLRGFLAHHHLYHAEALLQTEENPVLKWLLTKSFVMHCARFGYENEVKNIFDAASPDKQHYLLPIITEGHARNHNNAALELLWNNNPDEHFNLLMAMTSGICSRGGKITELETLWGSINFLERKNLLEQAVSIYTCFGYVDSAKLLLIENDEHRFELSTTIMRNLFLPNDFDLAKDLLERADSASEKTQLYKAMVQAAITVGNVAIAKWLLLPDIFKVLTNLDATAEIQSQLLEALTATYMHKWHVGSAKKIIDEEQDPEKQLLLIKGGIRVCASVGNVQEVNHLITRALQIDSSSIDNDLIHQIVGDYIISGLENETNHLRSILLLPTIKRMIENDEGCRLSIERISHGPNGNRILDLVNQADLENFEEVIDNFENELMHQNLGNRQNRQAAINLLHSRMKCYVVFMSNFEFYKLSGFQAMGRIDEIDSIVNLLAPDNSDGRNALFAKAAQGLAFHGFVKQALQLRPANENLIGQYVFDQGMATAHLFAGDFESVLDYIRNASDPEQFLKDLTCFMLNDRFLKGNSALVILGMFNPQQQNIIANAAEKVGLDLKPLLPKSKQSNEDMKKYPFPVNYQLKLRESWPLMNKLLLIAGPDFFQKLNAKFVAYLLTYLAPMSERQSWKFLEDYCESASRPRVRAIMDQEPKSNATEEKKPESGFKLR